MNYNEFLNQQDKKQPVKVRAEAMSFGTLEECRKNLEDGMIKLDKTIDEKIGRPFKMLPEYKEIIDWLSDTKGMGLALIGNSGQGKTIITTRVIPSLMDWKYQKRPQTIKSIQFSERNMKVEKHPYFYNTNVIVGEVGRENEITIDYQKRDLFPLWIDNCIEKGYAPIFTANMDDEEIKKRYGEYIWNRIRHACKIVIFTGKSLW